MQGLAQQGKLALLIGRVHAAEFMAINVFNKQVSCSKIQKL